MQSEICNGIPKNRKTAVIKGIIGIILSVGIIVLSLIYSYMIAGLSLYGYIGLLIGCFVTNATLFIPTVSVSLVIAFSTALSPIFCGIVAAIGCTLGELVGYSFGRSGRALVKDNKLLQRTKKYLDKYGVVIVFIYAAIPIPFFDIAGILCGVSRVSVVKFSVACFLGKTIKMILYAYLGSYSIDIIKEII